MQTVNQTMKLKPGRR